VSYARGHRGGSARDVEVRRGARGRAARRCRGHRPGRAGDLPPRPHRVGRTRPPAGGRVPHHHRPGRDRGQGRRRPPRARSSRVVPGARLCGGSSAIDGCLVLCLERMDRILEVDAVDQQAVLEPGVINADISIATADVGLWYPPDPASKEFCSIGGNIATNAGGLCCVKYGVTRDHVLGLEVVLADGTVIETGRRTIKGVAGLDLTQLLIGQRGHARHRHPKVRVRSRRCPRVPRRWWRCSRRSARPAPRSPTWSPAACSCRCSSWSTAPRRWRSTTGATWASTVTPRGCCSPSPTRPSRSGAPRWHVPPRSATGPARPTPRRPTTRPSRRCSCRRGAWPSRRWSGSGTRCSTTSRCHARASPTSSSGPRRSRSDAG
jgi:hypothetical protein